MRSPGSAVIARNAKIAVIDWSIQGTKFWQFRRFWHLWQLLSRASTNWPACRPAGVEIVPVQDRVEPEEEVALRLPAPERTVREHHNMSLADRRIDRDGAARERVAADEDPGQEQIVR